MHRKSQNPKKSQCQNRKKRYQTSFVEKMDLEILKNLHKDRTHVKNLTFIFFRIQRKYSKLKLSRDIQPMNIPIKFEYNLINACSIIGVYGQTDDTPWQ